MSPSSQLHVVIGSSGGAGNAIARALVDAGLTTRAVNRSGAADLPGHIEQVAADITTGEGLARAVGGAGVVYMAAQPPYHRWPEQFPTMLSGVIDATAAAGAKLVMVDNLYGYGPATGPMTEDSPQRASDRKGVVRRTMAETLLAAHQSGRLRVTIGRASDYFGPRADNSGITALAVAPVASGGTIRWLGTLDAAHSAAYLPDVARAYVTLGTSDRADGEVWLLPHAPAVTGREFLALVNQALPAPARQGVVSPAMLRLAAPFHRVSRQSLGILYQWTEPFVVDHAKFERAFGPVAVTPLRDAIETTVAWYRRR